MNAGRILWLIDNGHGSIDPKKGTPVTRGKRSFEFPKGNTFEGKILIEGVRNRAVVRNLCEMMESEGYKFLNIVDTWRDIPLAERTRKANKIAAASDMPCVYLSIHHDAYGSKWNEANGMTSFSFTRSSKGAALAEVFSRKIPESTGLRKRGSKVAEFWVLRKTTCVAVLTENGFMTNLSDATFAMSEQGSKKIAIGHFQAIKEIESKFDKYFGK